MRNPEEAELGIIGLESAALVGDSLRASRHLGVHPNLALQEMHCINGEAVADDRP